MGQTLKVVPAPVEDVHDDFVRVNIEHRPGTKAGNVVVIKANGRKVYRVARGTRGAQKGIISMDLATRQKLGLSQNSNHAFEITRAGFVGEMIWAWNATNAMPRIAARLAVLSVGLGLVGCMLGALSLWISYCT